jgi:hypothetical protein
MTCPDCHANGRTVSCVYDHKFQGEVCPRCQRVFSPLASGLHYVTKKAMLAGMAKLRALRMAEKKRQFVYSDALAKRIIDERN